MNPPVTPHMERKTLKGVTTGDMQYLHTSGRHTALGVQYRKQLTEGKVQADFTSHRPL